MPRSDTEGWWCGGWTPPGRSAAPPSHAEPAASHTHWPAGHTPPSTTSNPSPTESQAPLQMGSHWQMSCYTVCVCVFACLTLKIFVVSDCVSIRPLLFAPRIWGTQKGPFSSVSFPLSFYPSLEMCVCTNVWVCVYLFSCYMTDSLQRLDGDLPCWVSLYVLPAQSQGYLSQWQASAGLGGIATKRHSTKVNTNIVGPTGICIYSIKIH